MKGLWAFFFFRGFKLNFPGLKRFVAKMGYDSIPHLCPDHFRPKKNIQSCNLPPKFQSISRVFFGERWWCIFLFEERFGTPESSKSQATKNPINNRKGVFPYNIFLPAEAARTICQGSWNRCFFLDSQNDTLFWGRIPMRCYEML